jgi:two-component system sensor histidine kinase/response regulator
VALSFAEGDAQLLAEVTDLFFHDIPRLMSEVRDAVAHGDSRLLERSAHTLKGMVAYFGAQATAQAALRLEMLGREGNLTPAQEAVVELEKEIERLLPAVEDLRKELAN